ncbi:hypothetical protein TCA2_2759 [Paenibacillus sp. TCA20]|uniref:Uncharacterized protein n=3 Tax=Paenibacillus urinalis TaxID=521520 RepID=A0ABY7XAR0_9BACL|nr:MULTISPECIES: hypothetical protein [Paenibacillus]WDI02776.1 hypothetical protein PUW25_01960 [Paenibacillus urinalis]GAK40269.1 hypothetical protein TCA2_2759 [Paenibacillus sp. TCA20]
MRPREWKLKAGLAILVGVLLLLTFPWIQWRAAPSRVIDVVIVDKTVPDITYREHKGLTWLLNQQKVVDHNGAGYAYDESYYGYHPHKVGDERMRRLPATLRGTDLIYLADSYGIYESVRSQEEREEQIEQLVYGGMNLTDVQKIQAAAMTGTTIIAEHSILAAPTAESVSRQLQKMLGVEWKGWAGKFYENLSTEVPLHIMENYTGQTGKEWSYSGTGMVLVHHEGEVIVLDRQDLREPGMSISFSKENSDKYNVERSARYHQWFEVVTPKPGTETVADYKLELTSSGSEKLRTAGVPAQFPAIIHKEQKSHQSYYFAGDFAERTVSPFMVQYKGWDQFVGLFVPNSSPNAFYWNIYIPLMKTILSDIESNRV